jgi:hypothetical protein
MGDEVVNAVVQVTPPSVDCCHLKTVPVYADNVMLPLFVPAHADADPAAVPPSDAGVTVIIEFEEYVPAQPPL